MKNFMITSVLLLNSFAVVAGGEQTYNRYEKTSECQEPPTLNKSQYRTVEEYKMLGYNSWETQGQIYFCSNEKPIPVEPLCKFKVTGNGVSRHVVIKPLPIVERDEIKWLFQIEQNGFVFSVNTVKLFAYMFYTISEQRSGAVIHSSTGSTYNYYSNKNGRAFESKNVLHGITYNMECNFYDVAPTTSQR